MQDVSIDLLAFTIDHIKRTFASGDALQLVHHLFRGLLNKFIKTTVIIDGRCERVTASSKTAQSATKILVSGDLGKVCVSEGLKWVTIYFSSDKEKKPPLWTPNIEQLIRDIATYHKPNIKVSKGYLVYTVAVFQHILKTMIFSPSMSVSDVKKSLKENRELDVLFYGLE